MAELKDLAISECSKQMGLSLERIEKCLEKLEEPEVWVRANSASNSIGNLMLHLEGNIRQWIVSAMGGGEDRRNRQSEFSRTEGSRKRELFESLSATINQAKIVIENRNEEQLCSAITIQGFETNQVAAIIHVVEHLSYHTGQIVWQTKALKAVDLGFYSGRDLDTRN